MVQFDDEPSEVREVFLMAICQNRWFFIKMSNKAQENSIHLPWYHTYCCFNKTSQRKIKCSILLRVVVYVVVARARHNFLSGRTAFS